MKKLVVLAVLTILLTSMTDISQAAGNQLIPVGIQNRNLNSEYSAQETYVFDLPSGLPSNSLSTSNIDVYYVYKDADGNNSYPGFTDTNGSAIRMYSRKVEGNRFWMTITFSFMGNYNLTFVAKVGAATYSYELPVSVTFQKSGNGLGFLGPNYVQSLPKGSISYVAEKSSGKSETFVNVTNNAPSDKSIYICVGVISKIASDQFFEIINNPIKDLAKADNYRRAYPTSCKTIKRGATENYSITEKQYFSDSPLLYVTYQYNGLEQSPLFVYTLPIIADFPKPNQKLNLACENVYIEKTSKCNVTPIATISDGTQTLTNQEISVRVKKMDGSEQVIKARFGSPTEISIGPSANPTEVSASFLDGTATTKVVPVLNNYSPSEMFDVKWKPNCLIQGNNIVCNVNSSVTIKPGFKSPKTVNLIINASKSNPKTGALEVLEIRNEIVNSGNAYILEIPFDKLVKNLEFYSADFAENSVTWTNPKYVAPIIPFTIDNTTLTLDCPANYSGSTVTCKAGVDSKATQKQTLVVNVESKFDNGAWKQQKALSITVSKLVSFSVKDSSSKRLQIRLRAQIGKNAIFSNTQSWTATSPNTSKPSNNNESAAYIRFYKLMTDLWNSNSTPFSAANIAKFGGRSSYCYQLERASESDFGVTLSTQDRADFIRACSNFLISKGR